jgi:hypothetical protein
VLTYAQIRSRVLRLMDEATDTSDSAIALVNDAINASHRRLCFSRTWPFLRWPRRETFSTTSGVRLYALHEQVGKLLDVFCTTDGQPLVLVPLRNWESNGFDPTAVSGGKHAIFGGVWPVAAQPAAADTLTIVSSDAADGVGEEVLLRGLDGDGNLVEETLVVDGTTPVTSTTSFLTILNVTKVGTWTGTLTLATTGATTLLTLLPSQSAKQYPTLEFIGTPDSGRAFSYAFMRKPRTLSLDNDIPEIPFPHSEILVYDTLLDLSAYNSDAGDRYVKLWAGRHEKLWKELCEAQDETGVVGSQPRFVRDMDGHQGQPTFIFNA